jgi:hypothetical protein
MMTHPRCGALDHGGADHKVKNLYNPLEIVLDAPQRFTYLVQTHSQVPFTQHPPIHRNAKEVPT